MPFRKLVGSYKDYTLSSHIIEAGYLAVDVNTGDLRIGDGTTAGGTLLASGSGVTGNVSFFGTKLVSPSNGDIELEPGGTGKVIFPGIEFQGGEISATRTNDDLVLTAAGTGQVQVGQFKFPTSDGNVGQFLKTDGSGNLSFASVTGGGEVSYFFVGDDSTGIRVDQGETLQIAGGDNITTAVSGDTVTITGTSQTGDVTFSGTSLSSSSSSAININENLIVDGSLQVSGYTFPSSDGSAGQVLQTDGSGTLSYADLSIGDLTFTGSTISAPSNADLTLNSSNGNVVIEGIRVSGTTLQTEDSGAIQINGNLIPAADGVYQLGTADKRWQILYVSAETIDVGGATIKSDGSGAIEIAATGATLPTGSKVVDQPIVLAGKTGSTNLRPVQIVPILVSDGSTALSDAQLLAKTPDLNLEFNGTIEDTPVYTEANQTFLLNDGSALDSNQTGITLFQF